MSQVTRKFSAEEIKARLALCSNAQNPPSAPPSSDSPVTVATQSAQTQLSNPSECLAPDYRLGERLIELHSNTLRRLALLELITSIRAHVKFDGLSSTALYILRKPDIEKLISRLLAMNSVCVLIRAHTLNFRCEHIESMEWEEAALQYFVRAQASLTILRSAFPQVTRAQVSRLRKALAVTPPAKAVHLPLQQLQEIYRIWQKICQEREDNRERYIALHGEFPQFTLTTLCAALNVKVRK
ncbi:MAG: Protein of unknown function (DUF2857) [Glomeribacter sp. 1016415]|nr:Protein of unknown function (DUF2857) [Glomeribacter sp. 1016415]